MTAREARERETLRYQFVTAALIGSASSEESPESIANRAYEIANHTLDLIEGR